MRHFLNGFFIALALVISASSVHAPVAYAQALVPSQAPFFTPPVAAPLLNAGSAPTAVDSVIAAPVSDGVSEKIPTSFANKEMAAGMNGVMSMIMSLFAWLLGVAMLTLDYAVYYTVVTMGNYVQNLSAVGVTWRILRDIGNILLIFGFLAVGITTILNVDWYGGGKKFLPMLLVSAVFMNFSLFATEALIDTGNLFATQFYTQIKGGTLPSSSYTGNTTFMSQIENEGVSNKIMSQLGLQTIYGNARTNTDIFKGSNPMLVGFMGILIFITTAFVMFSLAFILIARFVTLLFLIIISPIGFAGWAVPQLKSTSKWWWDMLVQQTLTAPILLLLLYIALAIITDAQFLTGFGKTTAGSWTGFIENANLTGFAGVLLSFLVAMGLLLAVTYFSKKLGAMGGEWAMKTAGKLSFGLTAAGMRYSAGLGLNAASKRFSSSGYALRNPLVGRTVGGALNYGAKASFDVRGTGALKNFGSSGINAGEAQKGGYRGEQDKSVKAHQDYVKSVGDAIDERKSNEVVQVMKTRSEAEKVVSDEKAKFTSSGGADFEKKIKEQENIVKSFEEEKKNNAKSTIIGPERDRRDQATEQKLTSARLDLKTIKETHETAKKSLNAAEENLNKNIKNENEVVGSISKEKKAAQVAYAGSLKGSLLNTLVFGSGGSIAGRKIIKEALKKEDKLKKIKELLEEPKEEEKGKEQKKEKPEEKPVEKAH